ncbi:hypothetical protein K8I31_09470, partial [bacterium]|nr:hypothetical protein [bacterium]
LDSGTRLLRYNLEELGATFRIPGMNNRFVSSTLAVVTVWYFATSAFGANLWILFGTVNQLLAGLGLLVGTVYLLRLGRNIWVTALPMGFMLIVTLYAMTLNLQGYIAAGQRDRIVVGSIIMLLALGLILETIYFFYKWRSGSVKIENPSLDSVSE